MEIITWDKWCEIFDDFTYFEPIIQKIFDKHELGVIEIVEDVTPGTNAVFRVNNYIVKIYVPIETKLWEEDDYLNEVKSIEKAIELDITTPKIIAKGEVHHEQLWRYLVFDFVDSEELGHIIQELPIEEQMECILQIKSFLDKYNISQAENLSVIKRGLYSGRWKDYDRRLINDIEQYLTLSQFEYFYVHGDLTKENVLYNGDVHIIDFADSCVAPKCYEYPPIAFDLLDYSLELTQNLFGESFPVLIENLLNGLLIHDYGGDILSNILTRLYIDKTELLSVEDIKNAIIDIMK